LLFAVSRTVIVSSLDRSTPDEFTLVAIVATSTGGCDASSHRYRLRGKLVAGGRSVASTAGRFLVPVTEQQQQQKPGNKQQAG
jgi:hypothetical protein